MQSSGGSNFRLFALCLLVGVVVCAWQTFKVAREANTGSSAPSNSSVVNPEVKKEPKNVLSELYETTTFVDDFSKREPSSLVGPVFVKP